MRVGVVSLHTDPFAIPGSGDVGGMNVVVRNTVAALVRQGVHAEVLTRLSDPRSPRIETIDGALVRRLEVGPPRLIPKGDHEELIPEFSAAMSESGPYDLIHSHHWFSGMAALPIARDRGIPHLQSFHSIAAPAHTTLAEGERPESPGRLAGEEFLAQRSEGVLAVSHAEATIAMTRLGAQPERVAVVYPGVDTLRFHPLTSNLLEGDPCADEPPSVFEVARPSLVVAARLEPLKGVELALEALAALPTPRPLLRIAGGATGDDGYVTHLRHLADRLGIAGDVEWLGPLNRCDLADLMRQATIMLVPSYSETYGLVALEASASGVPVVASNAGGLTEAVRDGVTGVLVPSREPRAWAEVIGDLLKDPAYRARLGWAGRQTALSRTWTEVGAATLACYRNVLAESAP